MVGTRQQVPAVPLVPFRRCYLAIYSLSVMGSQGNCSASRKRSSLDALKPVTAFPDVEFLVFENCR